MYLESLEVNDDSCGDLEISYKLLHQHGYEILEKSAASKNIIIDSRIIDKYWNDLKKYHFLKLNSRSPTVKGLFLLYQTSNALYNYNTNVLKMSNIQFRARVLFPYLIYILQQYLPDTKKFLQSTIRHVYDRINRTSTKLVNVYINSFYLDQDVIKHNILLEFLGNGLKKFDPLTVGKVDSFYRSMFSNIFHYYFMRKQDTSHVCANFWNLENILSQSSSSTRLNLYKDVLYNLQVDKFYKFSPVYIQLGMNYRIFKNIIVNNEFQDIYFAVYNKNKLTKSSNKEYKLIKIFNDDLINEAILNKIKKLPTIFKLLKCVHIANSKSKPYNDMLIKPELVKTVILDELCYPFKNVFSDGYLQPILTKVSENFVNLVLSGEYINLMTLSTVRIEQVSFIEQLRKFVRICLGEL